MCINLLYINFIPFYLLLFSVNVCFISSIFFFLVLVFLSVNYTILDRKIPKVVVCSLFFSF